MAVHCGVPAHERLDPTTAGGGASRRLAGNDVTDGIRCGDDELTVLTQIPVAAAEPVPPQLLELPADYHRSSLELRQISGGLLVQERDPVLAPITADRSAYTVVTERAPTEAEWRDLDFAWRVVKHVKSNAIVYARDRRTLGIGAGQMSRIDSSEIAVMKGHKSELDFTGAVVASDAFFPFADGLVAAARTGARAAIQPGGSIRDDEVIRAANEHGLAMVFTGKRHFRH